MAEEKLLFRVSSLAALYQLCCGLSAPAPLRHPDLDFTEFISAISQFLWDFPLTLAMLKYQGLTCNHKHNAGLSQLRERSIADSFSLEGNNQSMNQPPANSAVKRG